MKLRIGLVLVGWALTGPSAAHAGDPCCNVTGINENGVVTAREAATSKVFQFRVNDQNLIRSLRVGQKVHADFGTQQVSVDGIEPCCSIVSVGGAPVGGAKLSGVKQPSVHGAEPCCNAVDFQNAEDVTVQLFEVKRTGNFVTATWKFQSQSQKRQQLSRGVGGWADGYSLIWEAALLDSAGTRFAVAKDSGGEYMAAKHPTEGGVWIGPGKTLETWAKFAVPANVTRVSVTLPGVLRPWENVAITQ